MKLRSLTMLTGRIYSADGATDDTIRLADYPHILVAGTTGSGKSTLMRMCLLSLAINTAPADLQMVLIDMKQRPRRTGRCCCTQPAFAVNGTPTPAPPSATSKASLRQRIERQITQPETPARHRRTARSWRGGPAFVASLGSIVSLGRLLGIHAGCRHPASQGRRDWQCLSRPISPCRSSATLLAATPRLPPTTRPAHFLPGNGAFLRIYGPNITRLQAYWLDDAGTQSLVDLAQRAHGSHRCAPVQRPFLDRCSQQTERPHRCAPVPEVGATDIDSAATRRTDQRRSRRHPVVCGIALTQRHHRGGVWR